MVIQIKKKKSEIIPRNFIIIIIFLFSFLFFNVIKACAFKNTKRFREYKHYFYGNIIVGQSLCYIINLETTN